MLNIAVIAHVDHGKTTLIDAVLKQSHIFRDNQEEMKQTQILDSNELEREKGITIFAKLAAVEYKEQRINIIDTPGHSDFSGEVERTLGMADGSILVVDAYEGVMPQTEFVLRKAFDLGHRIVLVINKIDKKNADIVRVKTEVEDLVLKMAKIEEQLVFPTIYAIARESKFYSTLESVSDDSSRSIDLLLDTCLEFMSPFVGDSSMPFKMRVDGLDFDLHKGKYGLGRLLQGKVERGDTVMVGNSIESLKKAKVNYIYHKEGLMYSSVDKPEPGDILAIVLDTDLSIGDTVCSRDKVEVLPPLEISKPTLKIKVEPNSSPLVGKEGEFVTPKQLEARILREKDENPGVSIENVDGGFYISGKGELQLSVIFEKFRREGYEFQIRKPEIILRESDGILEEPLERVIIHSPSEHIGFITTEMGKRRGDLVSMDSHEYGVRFEYIVRTRFFMGLTATLNNIGGGMISVTNFFDHYEKLSNDNPTLRNGVLISMENGDAIGYSLNTLQERGDLFVKPGAKIYEGMVVGLNKYSQDMEVNPCKGRHMSSVRMKHDEITQVSLKSIRDVTLEFAITFIESDEMIEVTPENIRIRKIYLSKIQREWSKRKNLTDLAKKSFNQ